jgi:hypothetical protein
VEKWTKAGRVERMLYAGDSLDKAHTIFAAAVKHRPRIRLTHPPADARAAAVALLVLTRDEARRIAANIARLSCWARPDRKAIQLVQR